MKRREYILALGAARDIHMTFEKCWPHTPQLEAACHFKRRWERV
jgi:hypothetical protein